MMSIQTDDTRTADAQTPDERTATHPDDLPLEGTDEVPGPDTLFEVLADRRRRYILYELVANGQTTGDRLVELLAVTMDGGGGRSSRQQLIAELQDDHLPVLVDAGLVRVDTESKTIGLDFVPAFVLEWIERAREIDRNR